MPKHKANETQIVIDKLKIDSYWMLHAVHVFKWISFAEIFVLNFHYICSYSVKNHLVCLLSLTDVKKIKPTFLLNAQPLSVGSLQLKLIRFSPLIDAWVGDSFQEYLDFVRQRPLWASRGTNGRSVDGEIRYRSDSLVDWRKINRNLTMTR